LQKPRPCIPEIWYLAVELQKIEEVPEYLVVLESVEPFIEEALTQPRPVTCGKVLFAAYHLCSLLAFSGRSLPFFGCGVSFQSAVQPIEM